MKKPTSKTELAARYLIIASFLVINTAQADSPLSFLGVAATDSYKTMHMQLFHSAKSAGYNGQTNNNDFARWEAFADLKIFGIEVSHAMLRTERYRGTTTRSLWIWLQSAVDFDNHVSELSKIYGKPDEDTRNHGSQDSPIAAWSRAADGIAYELVFEGGIAREEGAAIALVAWGGSEEMRKLSERIPE